MCRVGSGIISPVTNICAINVFFKKILLVVKTAGLCYVAKILVFVTGIVTHVMYVTALIVSKGMLL
jgi:hypothetical protein